MRARLTILLSSLLVCGCSQKHPAPADLVTLLVPTGRFIQCRDGHVLYVEKRNGTALQNITIYETTADGGKTTIHADTGTISEVSDANLVKLTLRNAQTQTGKLRATVTELVINLPM